MKALFIGDELSAAGFRLTGLATLTPPASLAADDVHEAIEDSALLVVAASHAAALPPVDTAADGPLVAVVPDIRGRIAPPDLARKLRRILGIET